MEDPYARLLDARDRGWSLARSGKRVNSIEETAKETRGFTFVANATSTGVGVIGQVEAEIWYLPPTFYRGRKQTDVNGEMSVLRLATRPRLETENFVILHENSKKVGFEVLRHNMTHPILTGRRK